LDQGGRPIRFLIGWAGLALGWATALLASPAEMQALIWTAKGHELAALTNQPAACPQADDGDLQLVAGRALFNAPQLLGGQAARAGVSCASCHVNGRDNPHFFLEGVSATPGTADVSSSFFSAARANGRFDPKPIPDLAMPGKISREIASGELEQFLRGLIVEEFGGRQPSGATQAALAAYVRSVRPCPGKANEARRLRAQLDLVRDSIWAARWMAEQGEAEASLLLVGAARHQLGLIDERLARPGLGAERRLLLSASRKLQPNDEARAAEPTELGKWLDQFDRQIVPRTLRAEPRSLYDQTRLAEWLLSSD
jgi:hypothetical protein